MVKAVVGANWGDEGKGKITDMLAENADIVVRFQGGANAGHTIKNSYGKFALHTLPSGVFYDHTTSVIGNGVALNVPKFFEEVKSITSKGVPMPKIMISDRAQVVMPYHILFDEYEEERLKGAAFGSTKSGIAPFYSDKFAKIGFQVNELFEEESILRDKINRVIVQKNVLLEHLYHKPLLKEDEIFDTLMEYKKMVEPYVGDVSAFLCRALKEGKTVLLEGQLGTLKDTDHGIYPMVTSSNTIAAYGAVGAGVPPYEIKQIVTVVKAYSSSVGGGDFVSEIHGAEADELRNRGGDGGEFGATTGRPRRVGWFDCVASKYGCRLQGTTDVAFTVLDVLGYLDEIPVCVGYEIDGEETTDFPVTRRLAAAKPVWKKMPGWKSDIRGIRKYEELPENCRKYVEFVEEQIGYPITMISNGPAREDIIYRESLLKK
ncbi:MAG: adenylosuccinate synthase [Lachnospiraceae bacterium]|nr:adenylosuccinate synthase [Lachnospiraceae bacterium]